jgi:hypothetical protein
LELREKVQMNAKGWVRIGLLGFLVLAIGLIVRKELAGPAATATESKPLPETGLVVYYFHGEVRCPTCEAIENTAHEVVEQGFADELASGAVEWRIENYELPANAHFATEYELAAPSVVLVRREQGQQTGWRNLDRVWELVGDKQAFTEYVAQATREMLEESRAESQETRAR